MRDDGFLLLGFTAASAVLTIVIITIFIILLAKRITEPLVGLCQFANKINANATEKDLVKPSDLDALVDGEDQIADLVVAFKNLVKGLNAKRSERLTTSMTTDKRTVYPRNELYGQPVPWKDLMDKIN
jgi:nitrogen fixation/metabolism regulation signal transduction histidine kinase